MKQILESLDEAIFTPELKEAIQGMYESSLSQIKEEFETKLTEAETKLQEAEEASKVIAEQYETKLQEKEAELILASEEYADYIKEEMTNKANAFADVLKEEYEAKAEAYGQHISETFKTKFVDTMDLFLNRVVEEYLEDNRLVAENALQEAKISALLEGFESLLSTGAVKLHSLGQEEKQESEEIAELKESIAKLIKENDAVKKANANLLKEKVISDMTSDMSAVEMDKFEKLAKVVNFNESDMHTYTQSLKSIKESVMSKVAEEENASDVVNESNEQKPHWSRFV
jgi:F0F1-type ATP synthase membrane subunit b/b'